MRKKYKSGLGLHACLGLMLAVFGCFLTAGCERDRWDHKPPSGQGSIIVDNRTSNGIYVYLDGYYTNRVSSFDHETYDLNPAVRRVVLDQTNGQRSWRGDVDVIEGKLTVVEVRSETGDSGYDVRIYLD